MNRFKHLSKIYKRDLTKDKVVFYVALIDGTPSPQFKKKSELMMYIADISRQRTINTLFMSKTTVETLIH